MPSPQPDASLTPPSVRIARPLFESFVRSGRCSSRHLFHARSSLPLLALFLATTEEVDSAGIPWDRLVPDRLLARGLEIDPHERAFLRDLLDLSSDFYAYLGEVGAIRPDVARRIRDRLVELALGLS